MLAGGYLTQCGCLSDVLQPSQEFLSLFVEKTSNSHVVGFDE